MAKQKQLHKDVVSLEFKGRIIRCREIDNRVFIPVADIAGIVNAINVWDKHEGVYSRCSSIVRIVFYKDRTDIWSIEPVDITILCHMARTRCNGVLPQISIELIEWGKNIREILKTKQKNDSDASDYIADVEPVNDGTNSLIETTGRMNSIDIAKLIGKRHSNVIRDIRNISQQLDIQDGLNFELVKYKDSKGEDRPCYLLTQEGCLCLASGYDANLRMRIINRWKELELQNKKQSFVLPNFNDPVIAARAWADQMEKAKILELKNNEQAAYIEEQAPLVNLGEAIMKYDDDITINELSKILCQNGINTGEHRLRKTLKEKGYLMRNGMPTQISVENGWMVIIKDTDLHPDHGGMVNRKMMITVKGQNYFVNKFLNN